MPAPYAYALAIAEPPRWHHPYVQGAPDWSMFDVSVLTGGVLFQLWPGFVAVAFNRAIIFSGLCRRLGSAVAIKANVADTCGVAIDVPWIVE